MKIALTDAKARLREIESHIAQNNPRAAVRTVDRILAVAGLWPIIPEWAGAGTGERARSSSRAYPIASTYRIDEAAGVLEILTVAHASQRPPRFRRE